ncbi:MAG: methylmalonyl Co-A mutase-associated GTPase MeaB [Odoribacteraceae bacterium]|nr:methylmalonyl Co-A mutase-associated GTPase MeaB [Odoribacteraceae bacterium]
MEHPENDDRYAALAVNKGIEPPDPVNPALAARLAGLRRRPLSTGEYVAGILAGSINVLSQAITLAESARADHQERAREIINRCLPGTGNATRVGITGVPGAGKSTFIETLGKYLTARGHKLAVLAIDPSSERSGGSILGDKTRMEELARDPAAYIRPSPSAGSLGGVARKTREAMLLCEAAGFDVILVETVGVGQSEIAVHSMVDFFLLVQIAGAGDELQGIKRGVMEMADLIVVNKADGGNVERAALAGAQLQNALHLFPPHESGVEPGVITASSLERRGIEEAWARVLHHRDVTLRNGYLDRHRGEQARYWMHETINEQLRDHFYRGQRERILVAEGEVSRNEISPFDAAFRLLDGYFHDI